MDQTPGRSTAELQLASHRQWESPSPLFYRVLSILVVPAGDSVVEAARVLLETAIGVLILLAPLEGHACDQDLLQCLPSPPRLQQSEQFSSLHVSRLQ